MFLKTGELKKIMKASLKKHGLIVGNVNDHYLVYSDNWGLYIEIPYASNKFKAAIMELIGDLPEAYECYLYKTTPDGEAEPETVPDYPDPYEQWKAAKDFAAIAPVMLFAWPHEYIVCQKHSDLKFVVADRSLSDRVISRSELDTTVEAMPARPSFLSGVLYWKNETTIYWVHTESPGNKALEVLFPRLNGISFFEDDWIADNVGQEDEEPADGREEAAEDPLPY
jgi:hypothetical protein